LKVVQMASPWRHPQTGSYYLRRQIPEPLRPFFNGKSLWKASLRTKDPVQAAKDFPIANADLERRFAEAREMLNHAAAARVVAPERARDLVKAFLERLAGRHGRHGERVLLELEMTASTSLDLSRPGWTIIRRDDDGDLIEPDVPPDGFVGYSQSGDLWKDVVERLPRMQWRPLLSPIIADLRAFHGIAIANDAAGDEAIADALSEALPDFGKPPATVTRRRKPNFRLRPKMRLQELFDEWKAANQPSKQTALEYESSVHDFIDLIGDIPVADITADDIYDYRDEAAKLPASMPRADRKLSFTTRVQKHEGAVEKISPATLKKRVGGIQALLTFASKQRWVGRNEGAGIDIQGYKKASSRRRPFEDHELKQLFESHLFLRPDTWADRETKVSSSTLYWLFLIGLTSGARLEEVGQSNLADVKKAGSVLYIDIDDLTAANADAAKSLKTDESRRLVPLHKLVVDLGFAGYLEALRAAGHTRLFPDLEANGLGKRTKEASRQVNRYIDGVGLTDPRLVFHSLRHSFKDLARDTKLQDSLIDQICGHAPTSTGGRYGVGARLTTVHEELNRIAFAALDWAALKKAAARIEWKAQVRNLPSCEPALPRATG
jgi:integrase